MFCISGQHLPGSRLEEVALNLIKKHTMRVLLVENSSESQQFRSILSSDSYYTTDSGLGLRIEFGHVPNFAEAYNSFQDYHPDIILVDLSKSPDEAFRFCRMVRDAEDQRHTGIIFLQCSAPLDLHLPVKCLEAGGDDFIEAKASQREIYARINAVYRFKTMTDKLRSANHKLKQLSLTDELTGLHNMRSFNREYKKVLKSCKEQTSGFGIIMLDLDHFKQVNDTTNHLVGSHVIGEAGKLIKHALQKYPGSIAARYGGDEYIACIPTDSPQEMMESAESIRDLIYRTVFKYDKYSVKLSASVGLSWVPMGFNGVPDDPIKAADLMLYRSKENGRNQVHGMMLRNTIDFDHIGRLHLIDGNTSRDHDNITGVDNLKFF